LRKSDETDPYLGAWRAYYKALVEAGIYLGGSYSKGELVSSLPLIECGPEN
jgi:hypothetical protein